MGNTRLPNPTNRRHEPFDRDPSYRPRLPFLLVGDPDRESLTRRGLLGRGRTQKDVDGVEVRTEGQDPGADELCDVDVRCRSIPQPSTPARTVPCNGRERVLPTSPPDRGRGVLGTVVLPVDGRTLSPFWDRTGTSKSQDDREKDPGNPPSSRGPGLTTTSGMRKETPDVLR